jgi:pimeloyl-ACP methyl ester carboxylesterase
MERDVEVEPGIVLRMLDLGGGPPVVLLAGFGFDHEVWDRQVRTLLEAGRRVVGIDLRGTGGSSKPAAEYALEDHIADVGAVLDALDLAEVSLVGWSFGGLVAFGLAARSPRVARLVLVGSNGVRVTAAPDFPFGPPADGLEARLVKGEQRMRAVARRQAVLAGFREPPAPEVIEWLMTIQMRMPSWSAVACMKTYARADQRRLIDAVRVPVLQITGEADQAAPPAAAHWLAERLADSRVVEIPECGHTALIEQPDAPEAALLEFV